MINVTNVGARSLKLQIEAVTENTETIGMITTKAHGGEMTIAEARAATALAVGHHAALQADTVTVEIMNDTIENAGDGLQIPRTKSAVDAGTAVTDTETTVIVTEIVTARDL